MEPGAAAAVSGFPDGAYLDLSISVEAPAWTEAVADLDGLCRRAARAAFAAGGIARERGAEAGIVLADDAFVQRLNRDYRGQNAPTNVLAFPAADPEAFGTLPDEAPLILGDVVVAYETVALEASAAAIPLADHLCHMIVHGMLHLMGLDHQDDDQAAAMEDLEARVLAGLGIADPYAHAESPPESP